MEGRPDLESIHVEPEVQLAHVAVGVDERVRVLLEQQVLDGAGLAHEPEQVEVAAEEHVEPHLDVVPGAVDERRHLRSAQVC